MREVPVVEAAAHADAIAHRIENPPAAGTPRRVPAPRACACHAVRGCRRRRAWSHQSTHRNACGRAAGSRSGGRAMWQPRARAAAAVVRLSISSGMERYRPTWRPGRSRRAASTRRASCRAARRRAVPWMARRRARNSRRRLPPFVSAGWDGAGWDGAGHAQKGSVTRLCRCGPLLSNRSNKVELIRGR